MKRIQIFAYSVMLFLAVTWSVLNIEQSSYLSGTKSDPEYFSRLSLSPSVISAYSADTSKIIDALRVYKNVYYAGAFLHALVALKK